MQDEQTTRKATHLLIWETLSLAMPSYLILAIPEVPEYDSETWTKYIFNKLGGKLYRATLNMDRISWVKYKISNGFILK